MQDTLLALVDDFKVFVMKGVQTLPLSIAGTLIVLGFGTANYPMLFFLVGMLFVAPLIPFLLNIFVADDTWKVPGCGIVPGLDNYVISQWVMMVSFFFGYMLYNAISLAQNAALRLCGYGKGYAAQITMLDGGGRHSSLYSRVWVCTDMGM